MLEKPPVDAVRSALDQGVVDAVRARLSAGPRARPDADAIARRSLIADLSAAEAAAVSRLLGGIDAVHGAPLVVHGSASQTLAADRFGLSARVAADTAQALAAVRSGARALLDITAIDAWWGRLLAEPDLRIVAALPDDRRSMPRALMVQQAQTGPTGDDRSFWITDSRLTDVRIVEALATSGLAATPLIAVGGLKLFQIAGYVQVEDGRLNSLPGTLSGIIGTAPIF